MRAQFAKTMLEIGTADPTLVVLVGDIGAFGLREFAAKCPGRFLNAGIREQAMTSAAAGLALTGFVPVVHSITPFVVERVFEQLKDDFCYHRLPGNVVSVGAGIDYAALGGTHHSYSDIALMKSLPGSQVFVPGTPREFDLLFRENYRKGCVNYFRLGGRSHGVRIEDVDITLGRCVRVQEGTEVTLLTTGPLLSTVMQARDRLSSNHSCEVIYVPSIKPLDGEPIRASLRKTGRVVVVEDHNIYGGLADEVRRALGGMAHRMAALGFQDSFARDYGSFDELSAVAGIDPASIERAALGLMDNPR